MYTLTDYTAKELRLLADQNAEVIDLLFKMEESYAKQTPELRRMMQGRRQHNAEKLKFFREHNVHLLTALQIVQSKETVQAN